jgi:hypothetical protein
LSFDGKVQKGSGTITMFTAAGTAAGTSVDVASAEYAGSHVIFEPQTRLTDSTSYYVKTSAGGAIKSGAYTATAMAAAIDTSSTALFKSATDAARTTSIVYNSLSEYACMPNNGNIPDVTLYWNTRVDLVSGANQVVCRGGTAGSGFCASATACTTASCTASAASITTQILAAKKYKTVLYTSLFTGYSGNLFQIGEDSFTSTVASTVNNLNYTFTMGSTCSFVYDAPVVSNLVRMYLPAGTLAVTSQAKQFDLVIPAMAVKDALSNTAAGTSTYQFNHEVAAPVLDTSKCNPTSSDARHMYESIVVGFNEVVQAGTGYFNIYSTASTSAPRFQVAVAATSGPTAKFIGKQVIITPKTTCYDARRRSAAAAAAANVTNLTNATAPAPSNASSSRRLGEEEDSDLVQQGETDEADETRRLSTQTCWTLGDLQFSTTYYVTTSTAGVVKDMVGNSLAASNFKSTWSITTGASDSATPKVVMAPTPTSAVSSTWGVAPTVTGYVYFSEKVVSNSASITLEDCGADGGCTSTSGGSTIYASGADLSYGDGSTTDGTTEYGLLKYVKQVPTANRKYKVTVPAELVKEGSNKGPASAYSYFFTVGDVASTSIDSVAPTVVLVSPTAGKVTKSADFTLYFNEDVQKGTGIISFCSNSDVSASTACTQGKFASGANLSMTSPPTRT